MVKLFHKKHICIIPLLVASITPNMCLGHFQHIRDKCTYTGSTSRRLVALSTEWTGLACLTGTAQAAATILPRNTLTGAGECVRMRVDVGVPSQWWK